jgi:hypothetical protein
VRNEIINNGFLEKSIVEGESRTVGKMGNNGPSEFPNE